MGKRTITAKRTWSGLPLSDQERLATMYLNKQPIVDELDRLGMNIKPKSLERQIRDYVYYRGLFLSETISQINIPESPNKPYTAYTSVEADDAIVISDIEIPDQNAKMLRAALLVGMKRGIKRLIYNGDVVATDQTTLNSWVKEYREEHEVSYKTTIDLCRITMNEYAKWFDEQYFVSGNHDKRVDKKTGGEVYLEMLLHGTPTKFSRYTYMYLKTSKRGWMKIIHPKGYSIHAASKLGVDLWANSISPEGTKCHIVLGHTHFAQTAWSPDSQQELVSTGCMRQQAEYKDTNGTPHREWQRGFLVIQDGYFYPMTEHGTNWQRELGEFYPKLLDPHATLGDIKTTEASKPK